MHTAASMAFIFVGLLSTSHEKVKAQEGELEGTWKVIAIEQGGVDLFEVKMVEDKNYIFRFENGKLFGKEESKKEAEMYSYSFPKAKEDGQKPIDFKAKDVEEGKRPFKCIYSIEKDNLKVAISVERLGLIVAPHEENGLPGSERPKSFDSTEKPAKGENVIVLKMKRLK
jgi:uncharacterized protein (TIGR03067 family)